MEYYAKFIGFVLIWFACSGLFYIVYLRGDNPFTIVWYLVGIAVATIVAYITGQTFVRNDIITQKYCLLIVIFSIVLGMVSLRFLPIR